MPFAPTDEPEQYAAQIRHLPGPIAPALETPSTPTAPATNNKSTRKR